MRTHVAPKAIGQVSEGKANKLRVLHTRSVSCCLRSRHGRAGEAKTPEELRWHTVGTRTPSEKSVQIAVHLSYHGKLDALREEDLEHTRGETCGEGPDTILQVEGLESRSKAASRP